MLNKQKKRQAEKERKSSTEKRRKIAAHSVSL